MQARWLSVALLVGRAATLCAGRGATTDLLLGR